ncbi:MAG TPA: OsmC family peroxiredoxin [Gemmatimonadaceae bacterium]|nr:OsmC family peroxiredoxin [Gemmatimonadaceae bacterium]
MPTRRSSARWEGAIKSGKGTFKGESGAIGGQYSFSSRFEEGVGSNPEELLAAAEAACYSMALSGNIERAGGTPTSIDTNAACTVSPNPGGGGFTITKIDLDVTVSATGIDDAKFQEVAQQTLETCPVSRAFHGNLELTVTARLS